MNSNRIASIAAAAVFFGQAGFADDIVGTVRVGGQPVAGAAVTLWHTAGRNPPSSLAEASTDQIGAFAMANVADTVGGSYYLTTKSGPEDGVTLMSVLGESLPPTAASTN